MCLKKNNPGQRSQTNDKNIMDEKNVLESCECGSTEFEILGATRTIFKLKASGILERMFTEDLGIDGAIVCAECRREYQPKDFTLIL